MKLAKDCRVCTVAAFCCPLLLYKINSSLDGFSRRNCVKVGESWSKYNELLSFHPRGKLIIILNFSFLSFSIFENG